MCDSRALTTKAAGSMPAGSVKTAWGHIYYATTKSTSTGIRAEVTNSPFTIVYQLATPFEISLDAVNVLALSGTNTLYADAGNITVTGASDPIATITALQSRVSALESAQTNM